MIIKMMRIITPPLLDDDIHLFLRVMKIIINTTREIINKASVLDFKLSRKLGRIVVVVACTDVVLACPLEAVDVDCEVVMTVDVVAGIVVEAIVVGVDVVVGSPRTDVVVVIN